MDAFHIILTALVSMSFTINLVLLYAGHVLSDRVTELKKELKTKNK